MELAITILIYVTLGYLSVAFGWALVTVIREHNR